MSVTRSFIFKLCFSPDIRPTIRTPSVLLSPSLSLAVCRVHKRTSRRESREKKKTVTVRFLFVSMLRLPPLSPFSFFCSFLSFSLSFSRLLFFSFCCACVRARLSISRRFRRRAVSRPPHLFDVRVPLYWCRHTFPPSLHISLAPPLLLHHRRSTPVSTASSNLLFVVVLK